MKSVFRRNLLFGSGLILLSLIIIGSSFFAISYDFIVRQKKQMLNSTAAVVSGAAAAMYTESPLDNWQLRITISSVSRATDTSIFICDMDGFVIWHSGEGYIGVYIPSDVLKILHEKGEYSALTNLGGYYDSKNYVSALRVNDYYTGECIGYVFAASGRSEVGAMSRDYMLIFLLAACVLIIVAVPVTLLSSRSLAKPLSEMADAVRAFARGDMDVRVDDAGREDEIGELARAINNMAGSLEKAEQSRREFVANVSHELKTPMTTIAGFADGMLDGTIPMDKAPKYLSIISDETRRLSKLVRRMLEISRTQPDDLRRGSFDVSEAIRCVVVGLEDRINAKKLRLLLQLPRDDMIARGDGDSVSQVIYNIIENAVKFASEGTELTVTLYKKGEKAYISVTDIGETIPESDLPFIFERFHKSDRSRSLDRDGVGLGLYIVKNILDALGEDIWARSRDGRTEFVFSLTLAHRAAT